METPDVLVVTKADMGDAAMRARRDLAAALRAIGSRETPVVPVSSVPPPSGIDELVEALDAHRASIDMAAARVRMRQLAALSAFAAEYGESGLRGLGGRRAAVELLGKEDRERTVPELLAVLERARSA